MHLLGHVRRSATGTPGVRWRARFAGLVGPLIALVLIASPVQASLAFGPAVNITGASETGDLLSGVTQAGTSLVFVYSRDVDSTNYVPLDYAAKRSTDHGLTWGAPTVLVTDAVEPDLWGVAGSPSTVVALFTQDDSNNGRSLMLYRSANGGVSWFAPVKIAGANALASVAVNANDVDVAWVEANSTAVKFRHSANGGASFGSTTTIGSLVSGAGWPKVAVSGKTVYVLWSKYCLYFDGDCVDGMKTVLLRRSIDGGATWKPVQTVTSETWSSLWLKEVGASGKQLLLFTLVGGQFKIWRSTDSGATFHETTIPSTGRYKEPDGVVLAGKQARLLWTNPYTGVAYYRTSSNGGATWGPQTTITSFHGLSASYSHIALVNGHTVVVTHCSTNTEYGWCDATT